MTNFIEATKIELKKRTPEELVDKITELATDKIVKDKEIARLNKIIDEALRFIKLHDLYHPANEFILLNILQGNDKKVDELTKAIIKAQGNELKEEGK